MPKDKAALDKKREKKEKRVREELNGDGSGPAETSSMQPTDDAEPKTKKQKKSKSKLTDANSITATTAPESTGDGFIAFGDVTGDANLAPKVSKDDAKVTSISFNNSVSDAYETAKATAKSVPGETPQEKAARRKEHNKAAKIAKKERRAKRAQMKFKARHQKKEAKAITAQEYGETGEDIKKDKNRFICFVGQLPHTTTVEKVTEHFSKIEPASVRLPTEKETGKGKGYAFLEFTDFDRMKTCLKLYHHSEYNDGMNKPRKVNIELTAGGGGSKSEVRKLRIAEKNAKLGDQRKRKYESEAEAKAKLDHAAAVKAKRKLKYNKNKERNDARKKGLAHEGLQVAADPGAPPPVHSDGLHPARMAMLEKNRQ